MELPKGWVAAKLNELVSPIGIFCDGDWVESKDQDPNGGIRLIQLADIGDGYFIDKSNRFLTKEKAALLKCTFLNKGDILIARMPDPLGRATIFPLDGDEQYVTVVDVAIIRLGNNYVLNKFCCYMVNALETRSEIARQQSGTTRKRIARKKLEAITIPLPPLAEQQRIIVKIDALFSKLDKGVEALQAIRQQLRVYRQAVLKWAFEGKLTKNWREKKSNISAWEIVSILNIIKNEKNAIKAGPFGSSLKKDMYTPTGYKIYGQEQVINGDETYGNYFISKEKYNELITCKVKPNDILISLVGTIGKVLILSTNCLPGIINPRLIKISLDERKMLTKFFKYYFESGYLRSLYKSKAHGATMDVLNLGMIKELPFPLCSIAEQTEIVTEIESRLSVCDKLEAIVEENLNKAQALKQSILKKTFTGQLVPQDPNDEPAEKLLERIKAERKSITSKPKPVRKKTN